MKPLCVLRVIVDKMGVSIMETSTSPLPKILYIEDNADARSLVKRLMLGRYQMFEAKDPIAGMELAEQAKPDLVLLDLNLPGMNGMQAVDRLHHILKPGTPVVALSADSDSEMRERAKRAGFTAFLNKPLNIDEFFDLLNTFLNPKLEPGREAAGIPAKPVPPKMSGRFSL
jgi:CheY-like chemotaxis protein